MITDNDSDSFDKAILAHAEWSENTSRQALSDALRESREEVERLREALEYAFSGYVYETNSESYDCATQGFIQIARQALATSDSIRENHVAAGSVIP